MAATPANLPVGAPNGTRFKENAWQRSVPLAVLAALTALASVRGYSGAETKSGQVAAVVVFGLVTLLLISTAITMANRRSRIEITPDAITYTSYKGDSLILTSENGKELRVVTYGSRKRIGLTMPGADTTIPLSGYNSARFARACRASGWDYPDGVSPR